MAIFGWLCLLAFTLYASGAYLLLSTQTLGKYNIGGVPTTKTGKVLTLLAGAALGYWWYTLFQIAPFSVTMNS